MANKNQSILSNWYGACQAVNRPSLHDNNGKEYLDWRLPHSWELQLLYTLFNNGTLPPTLFYFGRYWRSYEDITLFYSTGVTIVWDYAYVVKFGTGELQFIEKKTSPLEVELRTRAVRFF